MGKKFGIWHSNSHIELQIMNFCDHEALENTHKQYEVERSEKIKEKIRVREILGGDIATNT